MSVNNDQESKKKKILYMVFSLVAAIAIWMYVSYVEDPETTWTISNISVEFTGEDLLQDNNLTIASVDYDKITVTFAGRFTNLSTLDNSNVTAVVDLSKIVTQYGSNPGSYQLTYDLSYASSSVYVDSSNHDYITVTVEKTVDATIPLRAVYDGGVADGYIAEEAQLSTDYITVSGPQDTVSIVSYGIAKLNRENLSKSVSEEVDIVLMDSDGEEIDTSNLVLSQDTVTISVDILMVKEVSLTVNLINGSLDDTNRIITITPSTIQLSGDPDDLEGLNQLSVATIDQTKFALSYNNTYSITQVIPNDTSVITGETTVEVAIEVVGLDTKQLSATNIQLKDQTEGYEVEIITQSLDITLRGESDVLEEVTADNIRIVADLSTVGDSTGSYRVTAKVSIDGFENVDAVGEYYVTVNQTLPGGE